VTEPEALKDRDVARAELWDEERLGTDSEFSKAGKGRSFCALIVLTVFNYRDAASITL
jgi:hypothetical protein